MIPVNTPSLSGNEKKYLNECIDTGWISSEGTFVKQFEDQFSASMSRKYGIAVSSGSAALDTAVLALGIGEGDEVIMPTFTIISCAAAVVRVGAIPVLVDSDPITWNMDITLLEAKITPKTKAIMVVHIYGLPADVKPVLEIADKYNLKIIEDAAEMHGQTYQGKPCGSFGNISIFSFYPNKLITTGEGGMILTDNAELAEKCKEFRNLCFVPEKRFVHYDLGSNFRMTNLQAALGVAQLEQLDKFIVRKREIGRLYQHLLSDLECIQLPLSETLYAKNIYWVFGIVLKDTPYNAEQIMIKLAEKGIGTRPFFYPMHLQPVFNRKGWYLDESYPVADNLAENGFYIPSGLGLTFDEIHRVAEELYNLLC